MVNNFDPDLSISNDCLIDRQESVLLVMVLHAGSTLGIKIIPLSLKILFAFFLICNQSYWLKKEK